jgi:hypothetical protein
LLKIYLKKFRIPDSNLLEGSVLIGPSGYAKLQYFIIACLYEYSVFLFHMMNLSFLGGNSKTAMIAALSPADINYDETLSTLR